jgi:hypothetical protein
VPVDLGALYGNRGRHFLNTPAEVEITDKRVEVTLSDRTINPRRLIEERELLQDSLWGVAPVECVYNRVE